VTDSQKIPALTTDQMRRVDTAMIDDMGITLVQMMENAGRNLAELALRRFAPRRVTLLIGSGGNGGGGLAAARHLANRGCVVEVVLSPERRHLSEAATHQCAILERMNIPFATSPAQADLIIDALIGYSLRGDPAGRVAELIGWANACTTPVLSLDCPSGLDTTTGAPATPSVRATATMTLALPKKGLREAKEVGELYLADIGVPPSLYNRWEIELSPTLFGSDTIVALERGDFGFRLSPALERQKVMGGERKNV